MSLSFVVYVASGYCDENHWPAGVVRRDDDGVVAGQRAREVPVRVPSGCVVPPVVTVTFSAIEVVRVEAGHASGPRRA